MTDFNALFKQIDQTNESIIVYMKELEMELMKVQQEISYKDHLLGEKSKELINYESENKRLKQEIQRLKKLLYPQQTLSPPSLQKYDKSKKKASNKRRKQLKHKNRAKSYESSTASNTDDPIPPFMPYIQSNLSSSECSDLSAHACKLALPSLNRSAGFQSFHSQDININPQSNSNKTARKIRVLSPIAETNDEDRSNAFSPSSISSLQPLNDCLKTSSAPLTSKHLLQKSDENQNIANLWGDSCFASLDDGVSIVDRLDLNYLTSDDESVMTADTEKILAKNLEAREDIFSSDDEKDMICDPLPMSFSKKSEEAISYMSYNTQIFNDLQMNMERAFPKSFSPSYSKYGCLMGGDITSKATQIYNFKSSETIAGCDNVIKAPFDLCSL